MTSPSRPRRAKLKPLPAAAREKPPALDRVVIILLYLACLFGAALGWMVEYDIPYIADAVLGALLGAAVFIIALVLPRAARWVVVCAAMGIWGLMLLWLRAEVVRGAVYAARLVYSHFTRYFVDYQYVPPPEDPAGLAALSVFLLLAAFLFAALMAGAVLGLRSPLLAILLAAPFFWFSAAGTGLPPLLPTLLLFCGWCGLLFQPRRRTKPAARLRLAAMGLAALLVVVVVAAFPASNYKESRRVLGLRSDLEGIDLRSDLPGLLNIGEGSRTVAARTATRVNLSRTGNLTLGKGNAFAVRGDLGGVEYLRGFACSEYTGSAWRQGDARAYERAMGDYSPLSYPFSEAYYMQAQPFYEEYMAFLETEGFSYFYPRLAIRTETRLPYSPAPYGSHAADMGEEPLSFVVDSFLQTAPGRAEYIVEYDYGMGGSFMSESPQGFFPMPVQAPAPHVTYEMWMEMMMSSEPVVTVNPDDVINIIIEWEDVATEEEHAYVEFISEEYTRLPGALAGTLRELAAGAGIDPAAGVGDWHRAAYEVGNYVRNAGSYNRSPGIQPVGADFVEYFLTESHEGYCIHFATAAATMLRALGVPTRYVEGFVVPQSLRQGMTYYSGANMAVEGEWTDIPNANAHAWVEVWEPGLGWLPLEVTPGGGDINHPDDPAPGSGGAAAGRDPGEESRPTDDDSRAADSSSAPSTSSSSSAPQDGAGGAGGGSGETAGGLPGWARTLLIWLAVAVAAIVALLLVVGIRRWRRERRFRDEDRNRAALEIYSYLAALGRFGLPPGEEAYELAAKAKFSQHTLTEEERGFLLREAKETRAKALETLPLHKKLWFLLLGL